MVLQVEVKVKVGIVIEIETDETSSGKLPILSLISSKVPVLSLRYAAYLMPLEAPWYHRTHLPPHQWTVRLVDAPHETGRYDTYLFSVPTSPG